jgi:hypothetical protein
MARAALVARERLAQGTGDAAFLRANLQRLGSMPTTSWHRRLALGNRSSQVPPPCPPMTTTGSEPCRWE